MRSGSMWTAERSCHFNYHTVHHQDNYRRVWMDGTRRTRDFSGVSHEEALRRAESLIPLQREQAAEC